MAVVVFTSAPPLYQADDVAAYSESVDRLYHERVLRLSDAFPAPLILQMKWQVRLLSLHVLAACVSHLPDFPSYAQLAIPTEQVALWFKCSS